MKHQKLVLKTLTFLGQAVIAGWSSTQEAKKGGLLRVQDQPGPQELIPGQALKLQRNAISKKNKKDEGGRRLSFLGQAVLMCF